MGEKKPILVLDFDGVLHAYTSPWTKADEVRDGPTPGAMAFLEDVTLGYEVHILSSRSSDSGGIHAMHDWLSHHLAMHYRMTPVPGFPEGRPAELAYQFAQATMALIRWPRDKPPAFLTIDDRAFCFKGAWPTMQELADFQPWNKKLSQDG